MIQDFNARCPYICRPFTCPCMSTLVHKTCQHKPIPSETLVPVYQATQCHISGESNHRILFWEHQCHLHCLRLNFSIVIQFMPESHKCSVGVSFSMNFMQMSYFLQVLHVLCISLFSLI